MNALRKHCPEYLMEAVGLGIFMVSASVVTAILEHPASLIHQAIADPLLRRFIIGVAMGLTAIWVYFTAPLLGMLSASEVYVRWRGRKAVRCAKLHHHNNKRCIFRCGYREQATNNRDW